MNKVRKSVSILLSLLMVLSLISAVPFTAGAATTDKVAASVTSGVYEYKLLDDGTAEITKYNGNATELEIPSAIDGYAVISIGYKAFYYCTSLTSVTIPNSVTSIGDSAFSGTSIISISIPDSVTSIGDSAFEDCKSLTNIAVDTNNQYYTSIDGNLYNKDQTELIQYAVGKSNTDFTIPESVKSIGENAFWDCESLRSITIPESVTSIGEDAFWCCESLTGITIPDSVTSIGEGAFYSCRSLTSITIPNSVTSIGDYAYWWCTSLTSVTIPESVTSIGESVFDGCTSLTSVTIPESVTSIGESAFEGCTSLTSITIGNGVTSIGYMAFADCRSLTSITIPDSVTRIENYAFIHCKNLMSVTIGNSVTSIGWRAFSDCTSLTSVSIHDSVKSIGEKAFGYYYDLENDFYLKVDGFTIYGYTGAEAERYAKDNGFNFISLGKAPIAKTTITLKKSSVSVYVKGTTQIKVSVKNGKGTTTYNSSNKKVAKVSKTGKVTGLKKGTAKITVTNNGVKKIFKVTVKNPKFSKKTVSVKKGKTIKVKIIGKIKGVNNKYTNTKIAKITSKKSASTLTVKGLKKGNTTLKIKVSGVTLKLKVKVK